MPVALRAANYSNVMSSLAVFLVIADGTALAAALPKNSVKSKRVKDNWLKSKDLKNGKAVKAVDVNASQVELRVGESCPEGQAIRVINVQGGVISEVDDHGAGGGPPSGRAGGDLTGMYPNPTIASSAVNSAKVADGPLTGADVLDGGVGTSNLAGDSVNSSKVANGTLTGRRPQRLANRWLGGRVVEQRRFLPRDIRRRGVARSATGCTRPSCAAGSQRLSRHC